VSGPRAPATAALGAALALAGLGLGVESALLPGICLLVLAAGAYAWVELATRRARLERDPLPRRIAEDEPLRLRIRLRGAPLRPPGGQLSDPLLAMPMAVGPRRRRALERVVHLHGPGRRRIAPSRLLVGDPLGLWSRELSSGATEEIVVLPRVEPVDSLGSNGTRFGGRGGGEADDADSPAAAGGQLEVDGLRPYRQGSPASRIHWPSVARSREMLERRMVAGGGSRPLVVLDPRGAREREALERALRAAASLCVALAASGGCELLLPGERRPIAIDPALRAWTEAHVRLAVANLGAAPALPPTARSGAVFWVAAGPGRIGGPARGGGFLIGPGVKPEAAGFRVAGLFGRRLAGGPRARPDVRRVA
jgi:uncharacterized protein (DUF58 family)